jgi:hypothetical protein
MTDASWLERAAVLVLMAASLAMTWRRTVNPLYGRDFKWHDECSLASIAKMTSGEQTKFGM